ncbi:MAG: glycosyltransferase [Geminicoccaceae bacterium]
MAGNLDVEPGNGAARSSKNLLLVSWYFPPANAVAAIRLGKMARYLKEQGHRIRVVTSDQAAKDRSLPIEIEASAVKRTRYLDLDRRLNPFMQQSAGPIDDAAHPGPAWRRALLFGRRLLGTLYRDIVFCPDRRLDWSFTLLPALFHEIRRERPDVILVSGPPFSSFIGTAMAAWWLDIPWIAEFRDRWVDDPYAVIPKWRTRIDHGLERMLVKRAAGIITVSDIWTHFYAGKYGLPTETVMNGFDPKDFDLDQEPEPDLPLRLLHAGTIYPGRRDPAALFEAIKRHDFNPSQLRVQFYGHQLQTIEAQAKRLGVEAFVDLKDAVPYRQAIELQKRSDILLLLQWNDPADEGNVPAKVFEYFATGRQILGLGPINGVPARLVRERKAGIFSNDPDQIAEQLKAWIGEKQRSGQVGKPDRNAAIGLDREGQYQRLERFCQAIIKSDRERRQTMSPKGRPAIAATLKSPHFANIETSFAERPTLTAIIDTEADFDWHAPFSRDGHGTASVLHQSRAQCLFDRFGIKPTYLIDYPVATDPAACAVLRDFVDRGKADVGIQLHPWTNPPFDELLSARNSYPSSLPKALQQAKIEWLIEAVRANLGIDPKVFKAGRYGFNDDTADLLEALGLDIDTSVVPFTDFSPVHGPNFLNCPHRPFWFGKNRRLLELPVTRNLCGLLGRHVGPSLLPLAQSRLGVACHLPGILARSGLLDRLTLTPEGMDLPDLKRLTRTLIRRGERFFTFVFHSPSLASGNTPYVRNDDELQAFLNRIEAYLRFFIEELGGEGRSALELRDQLLGPRTDTALTSTNLPSFPRAAIIPTNITGKRKQPASVGTSAD